MENKCKFELAWRGPCGKETDGQFCVEHSNKECHSCKKEAIQECDATVGPLVCGCYLCGNCAHSYESFKHVTKKKAEEEFADFRRRLRVQF